MTLKVNDEDYTRSIFLTLQIGGGISEWFSPFNEFALHNILLGFK